MDIAETTAAKSDQQNYDDYIGDIRRTVTITAVTKGSAEQPVNLELAEFPGRPYKPNKSMRRVLLVAWGGDSTAYVGRRLEIYGDPTVKFGGAAVGGLKIRAMSHIDKPLTIPLTESRAKRTPFTVQPLATAPAPKDTSGRDWLTELATAAQIDKAAVLSLWNAAKAAHANPTVIDLIVKTGKELDAAEKAGKS